MDPNRLTFKDVLLVSCPTIAFIIGVVLLAKGMNILAAIILLPLAIYFIYAFINMPWDDIAKNIEEKERKQQKTFIGRLRLSLASVFDKINFLYMWVTIILLGIFVYGKLFGNGS